MSDLRTFVTDSEVESLLESQPTINVRGYTLFPDQHELDSWLDQDESWPESWRPLSSNYHPSILFVDLEDGTVKMLPGFRDTDPDSGFYSNAVPVYLDLNTFLTVAACNHALLNRSDAFEFVDDAAYTERLVGAVANEIEKELQAVNGPVILPLFFGTLGSWDRLADPTRFQGAW